LLRHRPGESTVGMVMSGAAMSTQPPELVELPGLLARAASGISFIYQALDLIAARYQLHDAVIAVDTREAGRQIFRLGRLAGGEVQEDADREWLSGAVTGPPGLRTDPPVVDRVTSSYVGHLVEVALRLDLLGHDASHDPLTGLFNRRSYEDHLAEAVSRTQRYGWPFALVLLDLDNFKAINDRLGHAAGDRALQVLGSEVRSALRSGDVAARVGGDEFAVLVQNADEIQVVEPLADRLRAALDRALPGASVRFSHGVASFPTDADDALALTRVADERLYQAKTAGG